MNKTILISLFIPFYLTTAMAQNNNSMRMANAKEIEINVTGLPPESYRNDPYQILMAGQYLEEAPKAIDGKGVFCTLTLRNGTSMGEIYSGKVSSK